MATADISIPGMSPADLLAANKSPSKSTLNSANLAKAKKSAQDFEAVFLNSMFQHMFTSTSGDGPMGGSGATGVWRSMLVDEMSKNVAKAGGIGIADHVYRSLIAQQAARS